MEKGEHSRQEETLCIIATGGWNQYGEICECEVNFGTMWRKIASMQSRRMYHAVTGFDQFLYAFGGCADEVLSSVEYYQPEKNVWTLSTAMPHERYGHGVCSLNGYIFICGGITKDKKFLSSVEQFDPSTASYRTFTPMTSQRAAVKVVATGGCIYAIGGWNGYSTQNSVERLDPREGKWCTASSMRVLRYEHGVTAIDDYIYCTGGTAASSKTGERLNIRRNEWERIPDMLIGRNGHELVTMNGFVYAIGGRLVERFDADANRWFEVPKMIKERDFLAASVLFCHHL